MGEDAWGKREEKYLSWYEMHDLSFMYNHKEKVYLHKYFKILHITHLEDIFSMSINIITIVLWQISLMSDKIVKVEGAQSWEQADLYTNVPSESQSFWTYFPLSGKRNNTHLVSASEKTTKYKIQLLLSKSL